MAGHRYRVNKIKRMHSIVHGLLPILEAMAKHPAIAQITPGRINGDRHADDYNVTMQYFTESGMKLIARTPSSVQEVFVVTSEPEEVQAWLINEGLIEAPRQSSAQVDTDTAPPKAGASSAQRKRNSGVNKGQSNQQPSRTAKKSARQGGQRRRNQNNNRAAMADKYGQEPTDFSPDLPTDTLLVADHIGADTAAKLRQLRNQAAAKEAPATPTPADGGQASGHGASKPHTPKRAAKAQGKASAAPSGPNSQASNQGKTAKKAHAQPAKAKATQKETNLLAAWLEQADDDTFKRLSRKYKGHEK